MTGTLSIAVVESSPRTKNHYLSRAVVRALRSLPDLEVHELDLASALHFAPPEFNHLLVFGGEGADSTIVETLRDRAESASIWFTEDPYEFSANAAIAHRYDLVFSNDLASAQLYRPRAIHLPLAAELPSFPIPDFTDRMFDLSFVGSAWPNRVEQLTAIAKSLRRLKSRVLLTRNDSLALHLKDFSWPWSEGVDYLDFSRLALQSRTTLLLERDFSTSPNASTRSDTPGPRLFETAVAGACVVVPAGTYGDFFSKHGLVSGRDFLAYASPREFDHIVDDLLSSPAAIGSIAQSLQTEIVRAHTFHVRCGEIARHVRALRKKRRSRDGARTPRTLFVAHNLSSFGAAGGSELYLDGALSAAGPDALVLARDQRHPSSERYVLADQSGHVLDELVTNPPSNADMRSPEIEAFFASILSSKAIGHVVFNHLIGFPISLGSLCTQLGVPYSTVLHDYYLVCDSFNLLNADGRYCKIDRPDFHDCASCTRRRGRPKNFQPARRDAASRFLTDASAVITNARWVADLVSAATGATIQDEKLHVIAPPFLGANIPGQISRDDRLQVAIVGNIKENKGSKDLLRIVRMLSGHNVSFQLFGYADSDIVTGLSGAPNVTFHGAYDVLSYPASKIASCHVALFLSNWPETHCISLTETMSLGLVPICYDIGAFHYRVGDSYGFLAKDSDDVINIIRYIMANPGELLGLAEHLPHFDNNFVEDFKQYLVQIDTSQTISEGSGRFIVEGLFPEARWPQVRRPPSHVVFGNYLRTHGWKQTARHVLGHLRRRIVS